MTSSVGPRTVSASEARPVDPSPLSATDQQATHIARTSLWKQRLVGMLGCAIEERCFSLIRGIVDHASYNFYPHQPSCNALSTNQALSRFATALAKSEQYALAFKTAGGISYSDRRQVVFSTIARSLVKNVDFPGIIQVINAIENESVRACAIQKTALFLVQKGALAEAIQIQGLKERVPQIVRINRGQ